MSAAMMMMTKRINPMMAPLFLRSCLQAISSVLRFLYILEALVSVLVSFMTSQFINVEIGHTDLSRLGAQVISGIGFLGAGTILFTGYKQIKGLTTAAGLWASACRSLVSD